MAWNNAQVKDAERTGHWWMQMRSSRSAFRAVHNHLTLKANRGPIGVGMIGIGGWGASNAASIMRSRRFNIAGVYDIQKEVTSRFANRFSTKCYDQIDDLLADSAIQAVCITVPNHFHVDLVKAAANAGKHVFIEKPLASHPNDCRALGKYCEDKGVILQVGHQMRREPAFREIKRILETGDLGHPLFAQGIYTLNRRTRNDWRRDPESCPGGSMEQLGIHLIDVLVYLLGTPLASEGRPCNIPTHSGDPDWVVVALSFPGEVSATICTSFSSPKHMRLEMFFERGLLSTDGRTISVAGKEGRIKTYRPRGTSGSVSQFDGFADCIEHGRKPETGAAEAVIAMTTVQSMRSAEETPKS